MKQAGDGNQLLWAADLRGESIAVPAKSCNQEEIQHPWSGNGAPPLPGQTDVRGLHVCYRFLRNTTGPAMSTPPITLLLALYPGTHILLPLWPVPRVFRLPPAA